MKILDKNNTPLNDEMLSNHIEQALAVKQPGKMAVKLARRILDTVFQPTFVGAENIPDGPCLFVGNHSLFAMDGAILQPLMLSEYNRFLRPMGDKFLWSLAPIGKLILRAGAVLGHPDVCTALMREKHDLLLYPGGAHESVKPNSERYTLQWKQRTGFVRLAAQLGYTIVPVAMVGPDEFYDHLIEGQSLPDSPLGKLLSRLGILNENTRQDMLPPIPMGALGTLFPKPKNCYIGFGKALNLSQFEGKELSAAKLLSLRKKVEAELNFQINVLLELREFEPKPKGRIRELLTK